MQPIQVAQQPNDDWPAIASQRYLREYLSGDRSLQEFSDSFTQQIISCDEMTMRRCVQLLPLAVLVPYIQFLDKFVVKANYRPNPLPFVVDRSSRQEAERTIERLEPQYRQLCAVTYHYYESLIVS
jgi:hypothetical protein